MHGVVPAPRNASILLVVGWWCMVLYLLPEMPLFYWLSGGGAWCCTCLSPGRKVSIFSQVTVHSGVAIPVSSRIKFTFNTYGDSSITGKFHVIRNLFSTLVFQSLVFFFRQMKLCFLKKIKKGSMQFYSLPFNSML